MRRVGLLLFLFLLPAAALAAEDPARKRLEAHVRFLADDLLEGRGSPGRGLDIAAQYLAASLRASGWGPAIGESYLQPYTLRSFDPKTAKYEITLAGQRLNPGEFLLQPYNIDPARTPIRLPITLAGWGIDDSEKKVDDFRTLDLRGKAALVLRGAPWPGDPTTPFGSDKAAGKNVAITSRNGMLTIYATDELAKSSGPVSVEAEMASVMAGVEFAFLRDFTDRTTSGIGPVLTISSSAFDRTLKPATGKSYAEWQRALAGKPKLAPMKNAPEVEIRIDAPVKSDRVFNVAGILPGIDPMLRDEWVVLTAHYDHLGAVPVPAGQDGIHNGADDNASGTAALLEIAHRLAAAPPPRRSVMILFVSAEERGLIGSAWYSRNPLVPMDRVVANINVDMVGRSQGEVQGISHNSEDLYGRAVTLGENSRIRVVPDQQPSWKIAYLTDSYHFSRFDIPVIEFFTGVHPDYHQPTDHPDRIRYDELTRIVEMIFNLTNEVAQGAWRPRAKRPAWFLTPD